MSHKDDKKLVANLRDALDNLFRFKLRSIYMEQNGHDTTVTWEGLDAIQRLAEDGLKYREQFGACETTEEMLSRHDRERNDRDEDEERIRPALLRETIRRVQALEEQTRGIGHDVEDLKKARALDAKPRVVGTLEPVHDYSVSYEHCWYCSLDGLAGVHPNAWKGTVW